MDLGKHIEHINLEETATISDIEKLCNEALKYHFEAVCVSPYYISLASELLKGSTVQVSTIIGKGYSTTSVKAYEAIEAINNGATEIELMINNQALKNKDYEYIKEEVEEIRDSIDGKVLKLAVKVSYLNKEELQKILTICEQTFIHFLTVIIDDDNYENLISTILKEKGELLEIKVNSNCDKYEDCNSFLKRGIIRIGTKSGVSIMKEVDNE